jgi:hypothetical protein
VTGNQRIGAWLLCICGLAVAVSLTQWGGGVERVTEDCANYISFRLRDTTRGDREATRTFTIAEIDPTTIPVSWDTNHPLWDHAGGGGTGDAASMKTSDTSLGAAAFTLLLVQMIVIVLSLWPYRILARKGLRRRAMMVTCAMLAASAICELLSVSLFPLTLGPIRIELSIIVVALAGAWLSRGLPPLVASHFGR